MNNKKYKKYAAWVIGAIILSIGVFYLLGYRISNFRIAKTAELKVTSLMPDTKIFLDNNYAGASKDGGDITLRLSSGRHSIIAVKEGYWPYLKEITAENNKKYVISAFGVSRNPGGVIITKNDPEYLSLVSLFNKNVLPTKEKPLLSKDGSTAVWIEDALVMASWKGDESRRPYYYCLFSACSESIKSFDPITEIRDIAFYKDRNDVLLVAIQNGVFALEIDPNNTQNFQPLYEGTSPEFRIEEDKNVYIMDNGVLMLINI